MSKAEEEIFALGLGVREASGSTRWGVSSCSSFSQRVVELSVVVVQVAKLCPTLWLCRLKHNQAPLSSTVSWSLLKFMSIGLVMLSNHLILCCPILLFPSIFLSIRVFSSESALCIRWPKYWSFSISPSSVYSGLISFRIFWFDLLPVQGTLKSLLQHHSSKTSTFRCSAFFMVQLSHLYMTTGKMIALTIWTFVDKVVSLLFNTLSSFKTISIASVWGVPMTTFRFDDIPEGLIELEKAGILSFMVYCTEKRHWSQQRQKMQGVGPRRGQAWASTCPVPGELHD